MPNLTDLSVQKLPEGLHFDGKLPSFGIRVGKQRKTWLVIRGHNRTKIRLGHYPAMSLQEARRRALVALGSPLQERPQISFPDAVEAFLKLPRWRASSKRVLQSSLRHFSWKRNLDKITHEDVAQALEAIKGKSARAHALKDIRTFFNWTVPRYLPHSPAVGLKMPPQPSRDRILTPEELKAVWNAAEGTFGMIVKLLILTGQRKMEIGGLRSDHINGEVAELPPEVTKNGRPHQFPIGPLTQSLLPERKGYLFRSSKNPDEPYRVGSRVGSMVGSTGGSIRGSMVGSRVGSRVGSMVGSTGGSIRGSMVGSRVGSTGGSRVGSSLQDEPHAVAVSEEREVI